MGLVKQHGVWLTENETREGIRITVDFAGNRWRRISEAERVLATGNKDRAHYINRVSFVVFETRHRIRSTRHGAKNGTSLFPAHGKCRSELVARVVVSASNQARRKTGDKS